MLTAAVAVAALAAIAAHAQFIPPLYSCLLTKKSEQVAGQIGFVCPYAIEPFHIICDQYNWAEAEDVCASHGWQLAVLDDNNKLDALANLKNCTPGDAWIASFNGQQSATCFQLLRNETAVQADFTESFCANQQAQIVCQDVPVETVTDVTYTTTKSTSAILTVTEEILPTCPSYRIKPCHEESADGKFVLLNHKLPYVQAECACKQHGLKLADLTILNFVEAANYLYKQLGPRKNAWVSSWNGDKYISQGQRAFLALWTGASGPGGAIAKPVSADLHLPVLCEKWHKPCHCKPEQAGCICAHGGHHNHHHHNHHHVLLEEGEQKPAVPANKAAEDSGSEEEENDDMPDPQADKCITGHGQCPRVCKHRVSNLRVVKAQVGAYDADEVCRRFGWTLADYRLCQAEDVAYLRDRCCGTGDGLWIRSYEGVDGGACMFIPGGAGVPVQWVLTADQCVDLGDKNVLCQTNEFPAITSSGAFDGLVSTFTYYTPDTFTSTIYTATVTTTVTLLGGK